jgi:signal transduction histidine kinase
VTTNQGRIQARRLITCAGLQSDRAAQRAGVATGMKMVPFRGEYYALVPEQRHLVHGLIYPVLNPNFPFLGVHLTRMINGTVHAGPNAVPAFKREGYRKTDVVSSVVFRLSTAACRIQICALCGSIDCCPSTSCIEPMRSPDDETDLLAVLRRLRWPLAGAVGLIFALTRLVETILLGAAESAPLTRTLDPIFWGLLAAIAVYAVLSWAARQEQRRRVREKAMLSELRASNSKLELLYELNQRIASSATLDEVLDYAITLPQRLLGASAVAFVLRDDQGAPLTARCVGLSEEALAGARTAFGLRPEPTDLTRPLALTARSASPNGIAGAVVIPLVERNAAPIGWIEAYRTNGSRAGEDAAAGVLSDELTTLLITIAGELTEAIVNSRRRAREIASVAALERAIADERTRIARDLHDGVAQSLAFLRMRVDLWDDWIEQDPARLRAEFVAAKANLRSQIEELRRAIFALRPIELSQLGFAGALRRFVNEFAEQQDWELELDLGDLPPDLPHVLELAAFRFVQEGLNNVAKHAEATRVWVALRRRDDGLQIIVRDNGVGFDPGAVESETGSRIGLRQMRERATALDGHITVLSRTGAGTELRVWLPLAYASTVSA